MVGADEKTGPLPCSFRDSVKKIGLKHTVFVVSGLWPWIRKQNPNLLEGDSVWKRAKKIAGFTLDERTVWLARPGDFLLCALDAFATNINTNTAFGGMFGGIACQKVPVPAADLQD